MDKSKGLTLIELMITLAVIAILSVVALPSYSQYIIRSKVVEGLQTLATTGVTMNQYMQDNGSYSTTSGSGSSISYTGLCGRSMPTKPESFTYTCVSDTTNGNTFLIKMTGKESLLGYEFTLDHLDNRKTTANPNGTSDTCWNISNNC